MNVKEMVFRGEDATKLYACGQCGQCYSPKVYACADDVAHETARKAAEKCCVPSSCSVCGVAVEKYWTLCSKHREQAKLARAKHVPASEWSDPVFSDDVSGDWGEGFSSCWQEMEQSYFDTAVWDDCVDGQGVITVPPPAYCWPCESQALRLDPNSLLENATDDMHEDAGDEIVDADELVRFIEAWNAKQTCKSWYPDYSRVIVLDEARFKALLEDGQVA